MTYPLERLRGRLGTRPLVGEKREKNGDRLTFSPHRLLAILAFFPQNGEPVHRPRLS